MYLNYALGFPSPEVFASSIFVVIKQRRKLLFSVKNRSVSQTLDSLNIRTVFFIPKYRYLLEIVNVVKNREFCE